MPIERYPQDDLQPGSDDAVIWRFMPFKRFAELMRTGELYFCRSDKFEDENEGLPTEAYARYVCANMGPGHDLDNTIGDLVQQKEAYFISCWYLFDHETARMWGKYGKDGVAICSSYGRLKTALDAMPDRTMLGLVRYSFDHVGWNILRFITTKAESGCFSERNTLRRDLDPGASGGGLQAFLNVCPHQTSSDGQCPSHAYSDVCKGFRIFASCRRPI